jgi:hypothetical protein
MGVVKEEVEDGEGEEEEEDDEEDDEEEEEEEEPKLKYQRLGASMSEILKNDTASCMTVHDKFLVCIFYNFLHFTTIYCKIIITSSLLLFCFLASLLLFSPFLLFLQV